ncbi:MAG: hypothetical protein HY744_23045 [Deltaproteobacteria bacterium]|nr:hypothetical protein [Deltaproteobacteria bacterium]
MRGKRTRQAREDGPSAASLREIPELDFTRLRRIPNPLGRRTALNVRILDRDVEPWFPDSESVNDALRAVVAMRQVLVGRAPKTKPRAA